MKKNLILVLFFPFHLFAQVLTSDNKNVEEAYKLALNTVDINIRRGILAAGAEYGGEWARDCAINSWNAASLLNPKTAEQTLWSVTKDRDTIGHQYWDRIIWVIAALNHFEVTGDKAFLKQAYKCSVNSIEQLEQQAFDKKYGLFTGPSVFNDGIAGYPEPVYDPKNRSGFVLDHKNSAVIKCLSTNGIYYGAYLSIIKMGKILKESPLKIQTFQRKADSVKASVLKYLYSEKEHKFY